MGNRNLRFMDYRKPFYAAKNFKKDSKPYERGDLFDKRDVTNRILARLFQTGYVIHAQDFSSEERVRYGIDDGTVEQTEEKSEPVVENDEQEDKKDADYNPEVATVVKDDEDNFVVNYQGVEFPINRNQIREDGTLTPGGLKAFKAASE